MSNRQQSFSWRTVLPVVLETMRGMSVVAYPELFEDVQKLLKRTFQDKLTASSKADQLWKTGRDGQCSMQGD